MTRDRALTREATPEAYLEKATLAQSWSTRAKYATKGLALRGIDTTTQAMLLRQLYLAHIEAERFAEALAVAEQMLELVVLPDAARQDAARACLGLGRQEEAIRHLRLASRVAPASRRAFHLWTLGSLLYLRGRPLDARRALERAARWATSAKPLYLGQLALVRLECGETELELEAVKAMLVAAPCGQGYGQFVVGELEYKLGDYHAAQASLQGFVDRTSRGRVALRVGLSAELERAAIILQQIQTILKSGSQS